MVFLKGVACKTKEGTGHAAIVENVTEECLAWLGNKMPTSTKHNVMYLPIHKECGSESSRQHSA